MSVKRSGDVTAAAVVLFFGSTVVAIVGVFVIITNSLEKGTPLWALFFLSWIYAVPAGCGVVTGIGILMLKPWARGLMLAMSALATCFCGFVTIAFFLAPLLTRGDPEFAHMGPAFTALGFVPAIPLGIAIWWLVLFRRADVKQQFGQGTTEARVEAVP